MIALAYISVLKYIGQMELGLHLADGGVGLTRPPQARVWKQAWVQIPVCPFLFIQSLFCRMLIYSFDLEVRLLEYPILKNGSCVLGFSSSNLRAAFNADSSQSGIHVFH
jgi:hypothetical protein